MFSAQKCPCFPDPNRVLEPAAPPTPPVTQLKPWTVLGRLQPLSLSALIAQLNEYDRSVQALNLVETHFPADIEEVFGDLSKYGWWELLAHMANRVKQADWFEIDWDRLNQAWNIWYEKPETRGQKLSEYLHYIPIKLYGFTSQKLKEFPPMELLDVLLNNKPVTPSGNLLIAAEIYDNLEEIWSESERHAAWTMLNRIEEDPGQYPEPVRWLPELSRWVCHRTGNPLLDVLFTEQEGPWFTWETDLQTLRSAWRRAKPVLNQFHRICEWYEKDSTNLSLLAGFLMEGNSCEQLDW
ncbi:MAG: hypothetical protein BroJett011_42670 [Chloroflexota bacterium]|nr:MAG: hypothetical protein BroJett011_42670 [Chloroflexota bacterium]